MLTLYCHGCVIQYPFLVLYNPVTLVTGWYPGNKKDWIPEGGPLASLGILKDSHLPFCLSLWVLMLRAWWLLLRALCCVCEVFLINYTDDKHPLSGPLLLFSFWKLCAYLISSVVWFGNVLETRHGKTLICNILKLDSSSLTILVFSQLGELLHICFYVFALVLSQKI